MNCSRSRLPDALVANIVVAFLVVGCAGRAPATPAPTATASISPAPTTAPLPSIAASPRVPSGPGIAWTATGLEFEPHTQATGLTRLDDGRYLLLGPSLRIGVGSSMAASSPDGLAWSLVGPGLEPVEGVRLTAAATLVGAGTVIVGTRSVPGPPASNGDPTSVGSGVVYSQRPGLAWAGVMDQSSLQGAELDGVIATPDRFIAFGAGRGYSEAGIWTSTDGQSWVAASVEPPSGPVPLVVDGIVTSSDGLLAYSRSSTPRSNALWASSDGLTWKVVQPTGLNGAILASIVATATGYLGVAQFPEGPTTFRSIDGVRWTALAPTGPSLERIIAVDGGFVAWGNARSDESEFIRGGYGVWTSSDGAVWTKADSYDEFYSGQMISSGRTLVSFGSANDPNPVWIGIFSIAPSAT